MDETLKNQLEILIRFWERSSEPWGIRDNQSRFIYSNDRHHKLLGLSDKYNLEGRLDSELPSPTAAFQMEFQAHDRKVELSQERITSLEIHEWDGLSYLKPNFCDKYPLIDDNGVSQGIIFHVRPVTDIILTRLNKIDIPTSLLFTPPSELFTKREWEVLFYVLHSFSSKEIAKKLHLSPRSVCNIIQSIYSKAGVTSKKQVIDYCYEKKINNYVPQSFFEYSGSFPLMQR
ncbi:helix-turn-helix transcriptional regulator [Yersinia enterocolitica]|uniref:helix-turn-helix transcriptional regulator n=1 Tax=Yersinia enterocolitica TaxID=630 RepID=UPI00094BAAF8|nr:LuxR C-terminal-related transcriptional regulator [Yersinia enterocolitica]HEN3579576.1 PAS domain-containing protein [Yersinia enterocolitica]HEN3645953.1 PAS domain-containing protein [Yersinia enterocolitica]